MSLRDFVAEALKMGLVVCHRGGEVINHIGPGGAPVAFVSLGEFVAPEAEYDRAAARLGPGLGMPTELMGRRTRWEITRLDGVVHGQQVWDDETGAPDA